MDLSELFDSLYPDFFESESIKCLPDGAVYEEMILLLGDKNFSYDENLGGNISFGVYDGDIDALKAAVAKVDKDWVQYFDGARVFCGYCGGEIASFCIVDDMGEHTLDGQSLKVGGPGCVGTVPEFRRRGIGLAMAARVTKLLADEGFDISYIHCTGVGEWYARLGYKTFAKWGRNGFVAK